MNKRIRPKRSTAGFTLIEVLVVIIIIGILFAIAAPGWNAYLSRQRVNTAREQVLQTIRQTQSAARTTRSARVVYFDSSPGYPRIATAPFQRGAALTAAPANITWKALAGDNAQTSTQSGSLRMGVYSGASLAASTNNQIVFDGNGAVAQPPNIAGTQALPFVVTVARAGTTASSTNRCVLVTTLLGATQLAEGSGCP